MPTHTTLYTHISSAILADPRKARQTSPSFPRTTAKLEQLANDRQTGKLDRSQHAIKLEEINKSLPNLLTLFNGEF